MRVKIFLLWLLALAIPVQGFAAAVQMSCAPDPQAHQIQSAHGADMHSMHAAADQHLTDSHHAGHDMHMTMTVATDASAATDHPLPHQHKTSSVSCSSCSVCTIGAILPLALDRLINLPVTADIHVAATQQGFVGFTPENPERPPSLLV